MVSSRFRLGHGQTRWPLRSRDKNIIVATVFVSQLKLTLFMGKDGNPRRVHFGRVSLLVFSGMSVPSWDGNGMSPSFVFESGISRKPCLRGQA